MVQCRHLCIDRISSRCLLISTLSFAKDATSSTGVVMITAEDNDLDAPDITVTVKGTPTSKKVMAPADATLTIEDDDERAGVPQRVTLASGASGTVTLSWFSPRILGTSPVTGYQWQHRVNTGNTKPIEARWTVTTTDLTAALERADRRSRVPILGSGDDPCRARRACQGDG